MTLPNRPLEVSIDAATWKLGDARFLSAAPPSESDMAAAMEYAAKAAAFLKRHTNWTWDEIDEIAFVELVQVQEQLKEKFRSAAVPLGSTPPSNPGLEASLSRVRDGLGNSSTPSDSIAIPKTSSET